MMRKALLKRVMLVIALAGSGLVIPAFAGMSGFAAQAEEACVEVAGDPENPNGEGIPGVVTVSVGDPCPPEDPAGAAITICANPAVNNGPASNESKRGNADPLNAGIGDGVVKVWADVGLDGQGFAVEVPALNGSAEAWDTNFPLGIVVVIDNIINQTNNDGGPQGTLNAHGVGISSDDVGCG